MELRIDPNITTADETATMEDVYRLHNADPVPKSTGAGITVAVMDTGVDPSHRVFEDTDISQVDFTGFGAGDRVGHGTAVAGLLAQIAPDVEIVSLRIFGDTGRTGMGPIEDAYEWLAAHADEVDACNFSWGATGNVEHINRMHERAIRAGIQDVVAAGNTGAQGGSPATAPDAFSVGAVTQDGELTRFSSYDPGRDNPDVAALGKNLLLPRADGTSMGQVVDDDWVKASGTSFAAPITMGMAARFLSGYDADVVRRFESSARNIPDTPEEGEGILDYGRATSGADERVIADAAVYGVANIDCIMLNRDLLPSGRYDAELVAKDTIQFTDPGGD